jgi:hypothetical protein
VTVDGWAKGFINEFSLPGREIMNISFSGVGEATLRGYYTGGPAEVFIYRSSGTFTGTADAVPEPATAALIAAGLVALGLVRRSRRRRHARC